MATIMSIRQDMITLPVMICSLCSKLCLTTIRLSLLDLATCVAAESAPVLETVKESPDGDDGAEGSLVSLGAEGTDGTDGTEKARNGSVNKINSRAATVLKPNEAASGCDRCGPECIA